MFEVIVTSSFLITMSLLQKTMADAVAICKRVMILGLMANCFVLLYSSVRGTRSYKEQRKRNIAVVMTMIAVR